MKRVKAKGIPMIIYEPLIREESFFNSPVYTDLEQFKKDADLILCNRSSSELSDVHGRHLIQRSYDYKELNQHLF